MPNHGSNYLQERLNSLSRKSNLGYHMKWVLSKVYLSNLHTTVGKKAYNFKLFRFFLKAVNFLTPDDIQMFQLHSTFKNRRCFKWKRSCSFRDVQILMGRIMKIRTSLKLISRQKRGEWGREREGSRNKGKFLEIFWGNICLGLITRGFNFFTACIVYQRIRPTTRKQYDFLLWSAFFFFRKPRTSYSVMSSSLGSFSL